MSSKHVVTARSEYRVFVNRTQKSSHATEREALAVAFDLKEQSPNESVSIDHDLQIDVELKGDCNGGC